MKLWSSSAGGRRSEEKGNKEESLEKQLEIEDCCLGMWTGKEMHIWDSFS